MISNIRIVYTIKNSYDILIIVYKGNNWNNRKIDTIDNHWYN